MRNLIRIHLCMKFKGEYIKKLYRIKRFSDVRSDIRGVERKILHVCNFYTNVYK
jgi:hypothetical protein